jgi:hypothetical protein
MYVGFIILSIIIALIRRGKFSNIKYFKFSLWYLLILALLVYAGYIAGTIMEIPFVIDYGYWIYFSVYVLVMITVVFNLNNIWSYILVIGIGLNFTATFLNGGKMPILQSALDMAKITDGGQFYLSYFGATNQVVATNPYVMGLCKIIGIPLGVTGLPISAGDIVIAISVFFIIQKMMVVPKVKKASPQERLAYTDQLHFTSEFNIDEIVSAAGETGSDLDEYISTVENGTADTQATSPIAEDMILGGNEDDLHIQPSILSEDDMLLGDNDSADISKENELSLENGDLLLDNDIQNEDNDEYDSLLEKLDNISGDQEESETEMPIEDDMIQEKEDTDAVQEDENISKLLEDLQESSQQQPAEEISEDDLNLSTNEEIQAIVSELVEDEPTEMQEDLSAANEKSEEADEMLNYMISIFDKHKKEQSKMEAPPVDEEYTEDKLLDDLLQKEDVTIFKPASKTELFEEPVAPSAEKEFIRQESQEPMTGEHDDEMDTTNPFIIQNGRIVENPNYKFRKNSDIDSKRKVQEVKEEAVIAFDSTQNLEFIRKEIFAELKRQEEEAMVSAAPTTVSKNTTVNETQVIPNLDNALNSSSEQAQTQKTAPVKANSKEEYERVEFEIDGKIMYVWIKK